MNDDEILERLRRIDPLDRGMPITPVNSAQALTLLETIIATEPPSRNSGRGSVGSTSAAPKVLTRPSRRRWYSTAAAGAAAAAVAVAVAVVLPDADGGRALAWTSVPRVATDADADVARKTCSGLDWAGSGASEAGDRGDVAPAPFALGTLAALDLRGNGGLAVFVDDENVVMCMLAVVDGTPQYAGGMSTAVAAEKSGTLTVDGGMTTGIGSDTAVSMLAGQAGTAAFVEIKVDGLDPIAATLVDGRFAAWWPEPASGSGTSLDAPITIVSYAADGSQLTSVVWTVARQTTDTVDRQTTDTPTVES